MTPEHQVDPEACVAAVGCERSKRRDDLAQASSIPVLSCEATLLSRMMP
jgi:hypothetical protein